MNNTKKVLILGGNGFIGTNLVKTFCKDKRYSVACFDCVDAMDKQADVYYITGDFYNDDQLMSLVDEYDILYHAVSCFNVSNSSSKYMNGYEKDFIQSVKLCEYVKNAGKKLIFLSSSTVYGRHEKMPVSENDFCQPINHYATVKHCIETVMETFRNQDEAGMIVARISNPYGPGQDYTKGIGVIDAIIRNAINGTPMTVWGDGEVVRDYIFVDDVCAMLAVLAEYKGNHGIFNISSGTGHSINEIIDLVRKQFPNLEVQYSRGRSVDLKEIVLNNSRIRSIYHEPLVSLSEGIQRSIAYTKNVITRVSQDN